MTEIPNQPARKITISTTTYKVDIKPYSEPTITINPQHARRASLSSAPPNYKKYPEYAAEEDGQGYNSDSSNSSIRAVCGGRGKPEAIQSAADKMNKQISEAQKYIQSQGGRIVNWGNLSSFALPSGRNKDDDNDSSSTIAECGDDDYRL